MVIIVGVLAYDAQTCIENRMLGCTNEIACFCEAPINALILL